MTRPPASWQFPLFRNTNGRIDFLPPLGRHRIFHFVETLQAQKLDEEVEMDPFYEMTSLIPEAIEWIMQHELHCVHKGHTVTSVVKDRSEAVYIMAVVLERELALISQEEGDERFDEYEVTYESYEWGKDAQEFLERRLTLKANPTTLKTNPTHPNRQSKKPKKGQKPPEPPPTVDPFGGTQFSPEALQTLKVSPEALQTLRDRFIGVSDAILIDAFFRTKSPGGAVKNLKSRGYEPQY